VAQESKVLIFDSWAVLAYFEDEPAAAAIEEMIADARDQGISILMSVINVGEVWYTLARRVSAPAADEAILQLQQIGIRFINVDWTLTREAAAFKSKNRMSYADAFAAALAGTRHAQLVTGDPEFKPLEKLIDICWV
jgi:predicted nucleic acid-binding protein